MILAQHGINSLRRGSSDIVDLSNRVIIDPIAKIVIVDPNGYIGYDITKYLLYPYNPAQSTYYNGAILSPDSDFSSYGLGRVTIRPSSIETIGDHDYITVQIGNQIWMAENLDCKFQGLSIGSATMSYDTPQGNYYMNQEDSYGYNGCKAGLLYNWKAVQMLEQNKASLIPGWHVPTIDEWDTLASFVRSAFYLKHYYGWQSGSGVNSYGFNAYGCGFFNNANFGGWHNNLGFWTATEVSTTEAYNRNLNSFDNVIGRNPRDKQNQYSLRLVKDSA